MIERGLEQDVDFSIPPEDFVRLISDFLNVYLTFVADASSAVQKTSDAYVIRLFRQT